MRHAKTASGNPVPQNGRTSPPKDKRPQQQTAITRNPHKPTSPAGSFNTRAWWGVVAWRGRAFGSPSRPPRAVRVAPPLPLQPVSGSSPSSPPRGTPPPSSPPSRNSRVVVVAVWCWWCWGLQLFGDIWYGGVSIPSKPRRPSVWADLRRSP